jgi:CheY-like chemotaxis protein
MTAMAMAGDKTSCLNSGMDDYISKPINIEKVKKIIRRFT